MVSKDHDKCRMESFSSLPICGKDSQVVLHLLCDTMTSDVSYLYDKRYHNSVAYLKWPETRHVRRLDVSVPH
jgi:hypothetical protein